MSILNILCRFSYSRSYCLSVYYTRWQNTIKSSYYYELNKLKNIVNAETLDKILTEVDKQKKREMHENEKRHTSKLKRDREVYTYPYLNTQYHEGLKSNSSNHVKPKNRRFKKKNSCRNRPRSQLKGDIPTLDNIPVEKLQASAINLSSQLADLTPHQLLLFYYGKKFAPTPPLPDYSKFRLDILQFAYKLRWAWHWFKHPKPQSSSTTNCQITALERKLCDRNDTKPIQSSSNNCLELYIEKISNDLLQPKNSYKTMLPDNLQKESRMELEKLANNRDIVIRPSDKGSVIFILDRKDYVHRTLQKLNDTSTFSIVEDKAAAISTITDSIKQWTVEFAEEPGMTPSVISSITPKDSCKPGNNYLNPKAHKPEENYPGRLISTACASYTRKLSGLTAVELDKVELKYIAKDLNHLLRKIDVFNKEGLLDDKDNVMLVSLDIVNMFPNISKLVGLQECKAHLDKRHEPIFSTECILKALEITLDNNLTEFEGVVYKQCKGTAMGPPNACSYADVTMNKIDIEVNEGTQWPSKYRPLIWIRFRDDVFVLWTHGRHLLDKFLEWLNTLLPGIKFTMVTSSQGVSFLNTFIYLIGHLLHTRPFSKPCDTHTYLIPSSCHATHNLRNIPYSVALTIYKICSEPTQYAKSKLEYTEHLKTRGYCTKFIEEEFSRVEQKDRVSYFSNDLIKSSKDDSRMFALVCDYNPGLPNVGNVLRKHKHILNLDEDLLKVIKPDNIVASYRSAKTLQDTLIHSKLPKLERTVEATPTNSISDQRVHSDAVSIDGGCKGCLKGCAVCKYFLKATTTVTSFHTNSIFKIIDQIDCNTPGIVYLINDLLCRRSYTGTTTDTIKVRFPNHKSHIKFGRKNCLVSKHFTENSQWHPLDITTQSKFDNCLSEQLEIILIEKVKIPSDLTDTYDKLKFCETRERFWRDRLRTLEDYGGLNIREEKKKHSLL